MPSRPTPSATRSEAGSENADGGQVATVLAALDATRSQAFSRRAPTLLDRVYVPGPLRNQDAALLARLVPIGCGLQGVHTSYRTARVRSLSAGRIEVSVEATLGPSVLVCRGVPAGRAPGSPTTRLVVVLVPAGSTMLIASQERS